MTIDKLKLDIVRARRGMKLSDLKVSKTTLARISRGLPLKPTTVGKVADALGCDPEELIQKEV